MLKKILLKIGQGLFLLIMGLIVYAMVTRDASPGDVTMFLFRWPVLLIVFVLAPLVALRIFLHPRRQEKARKPIRRDSHPE